MVRLVVLVLLVALVGISFTRHRIVVFCVFYCSYYLLHVIWHQDLQYSSGLRMYQSIYPILLISLFIGLFVTRDTQLRFHQIPGWPYFALGFVWLVAVFKAPPDLPLWSTSTMSLATPFFFFSLFWVVALFFQKQSDVSVFAWTTTIVSVIISVWVIWGARRSDFTYNRGIESVGQNYAALFLIAGAIPLIDMLFKKNKSRYKAVLFGLLLIIVYASLLLASRGMFITLLAATGAMFLRRSKNLSVRRKLLVAVGVLLAMAGTLFLPGADNLLRRFQQADVLSMDQRTIIWDVAIHHFAGLKLTDVLFGEGLFSSRALIARHLVGIANVHNMFLEWLLEEGVIGVLVFCYFLYWIGRRVFANKQRNAGVLTGWYCILLVTGLAATPPDGQFFWLLLGAILGASSIVEKPSGVPGLVSAGAERTMRRGPLRPRPRVQGV